MSHGLQLALIALVIAWSAAVVLRRLMPRALWQAQARLSYALERPGRPAWLRWIGRTVRPALRVSAAACGAGCGRCKGCP